MTRLLVVNCNTSTEVTQEIGLVATAAAAPGTTVQAVGPTWGVASAEGYYDSYISAAAVLDLLTTWPEPYDAVVLAGFGEHGREGARQLLDVPVVDITEAAAFAAMLVGRRFGVVTTTPTSTEQIRESLRNAGVAERCGAVRASGVRVLDLAADPQHSLELLSAHAAAVLREGCDSIVLGCSAMAPFRGELEQRLGVPVIDGVAAAVRFCEALVGLGLQTSKYGAYATPDLLKVRPGWGRAAAVPAGLA